jgi:hypothetical protein
MGRKRLHPKKKPTGAAGLLAGALILPHLSRKSFPPVYEGRRKASGRRTDECNILRGIRRSSTIILSIP